MSNWITDNKPAAMVAGVGLLLFLGLSATGYIVNSKRSELDKKISIAAKEIKSANAAEITPSRSSNEELEKELNRYAKAVGSLETAYKPFLASSALVPTTPTAFQNELKTFRDSLISSCKKKNIFFITNILLLFLNTHHSIQKLKEKSWSHICDDLLIFQIIFLSFSIF